MPRHIEGQLVPRPDHFQSAAVNMLPVNGSQPGRSIGTKHCQIVQKQQKTARQDCSGMDGEIRAVKHGGRGVLNRKQTERES